MIRIVKRLFFVLAHVLEWHPLRPPSSSIRICVFPNCKVKPQFLFLYDRNLTQDTYCWTIHPRCTWNHYKLVLRNGKCLQYFRESFAKMSALKIESFRNSATIFTISAKIVNSKFRQKWKYRRVLIVYIISQLIFLGGREIAQEGGEILPKVSPKLQAQFWESFVSLKYHQNRNTTCAINWDNSKSRIKYYNLSCHSILDLPLYHWWTVMVHNNFT